ncbi:MAG: type II toxin-antitoxin system RelB/DinJ family antitoxin [Opitutaceae bacterium]|jgi:addiction module RelB/DinJ family antitoxin|nr:type II toxin-antitoxin system RelB/DinJ family antitoxin [Opitutaceae bacterium]
MSTTLLRARVDAEKDAEATRILSMLGIDKTTALNMYFAKIITVGGIPFETRLEGGEYARREYGAGPGQLDRATKRAAAEIRRLKKQGKLIRVA